MIISKFPLVLFAVAWLGVLFSSTNAAVRLEKQDDKIVVSIAGKPFATYEVDQQQARTFFREVRAADGTLLTRPISPQGGDHVHHTGIWLAIDKVNGVGFWHRQGKIKNVSAKLQQDDGNSAVLHLENQWLASDETLLLREQTNIKIYDNRLMSYEIVLTAGDQPVTFGDTKEGLFAFRMAESMRGEETGQVVNADGLKTADGCWGRTSDWVDYFGKVDDKLFGVAIFDHPSNFRPSRYHVRDYGLFSINPFGESAYTDEQLPPSPVTIPAGSSLQLRYGIYFHNGDTNEGRVADVYKQFLADSTADEVEKIEYRSSADGTLQPAMFYTPRSAEKVPLLVTLHTWSGDYRQNLHQACEQWCRDKGWTYIHPNFRGPNKRPEATGSEAAVQDIVDAVHYAKSHARIDPTRVYLVGASGGGYGSLLMAGRHPELWSGVSAWVPISDLAAWYHQSKAAGNNYWLDVAASCGGPPGESKEVDLQYEIRSPLKYMKNASGVALDINTGIHDGHEGSVPVSHSLHAFNEVARDEDRLSQEDIDFIDNKESIPEHLQQEIVDPTYGEKRPLLRRQSGKARVTIFEGGHELVAEAALKWLEQQRSAPSP